MKNLLNLYTVKQLPSGFWSVWFGDEWFCASCETQAEAEELAEQFVEDYLNEERRIETEDD